MNDEQRPQPTEARAGSPAGTSEYESEAAREVERQLEQAKRSARQAARRAPEKAGELASRGRQKALEAAERQVAKGTRLASGRLSAIAGALHDAGERLDGEDERRAGDLAHRAAGQIQRVADYLERKDLRGLTGDLERTARRHPAAFLGGLFVGGVLVGRFLRSSRSNGAGSNGSADRGRAGAYSGPPTAPRRRDLTVSAPGTARPVPAAPPAVRRPGEPGGAP